MMPHPVEVIICMAFCIPTCILVEYLVDKWRHRKERVMPTEEEIKLWDGIDRIVRKSCWLYWFSRVPRHFIVRDIIQYLHSEGVIKEK